MRLVFLPFIIVAADYASKRYIKSVMTEGMSVPVIDGVFHITYVLNPGAAFGLLPNQRALFVAAAVALLALLLGLRKHIKKQPPCILAGAGLIAGGALGNLIDRINTGEVVDFLDFRVWPVFNVADAAICIGAGCILWNMMKNKK
ncbi:MAG: signal peptidase II [Acidaminococcales bacterium]|nr:signal peptidase II [Acidaminococcales bacterium]